MTPFKNHKNGFAFIEIMIAILLLAIFGTNLFMTQAKIFSNVWRTHDKVINTIESNLILPEFITKKIDAKKERKPFDTINIQKEIKNPPSKIQLVLKKINEKSEIFKDFENDVHLITQTIIRNDKKSQIISFLFTPPVEQKEQSSNTESSRGARTT